MVTVKLADGTVIAESSNTIVVEGNHYFPPGDIKKELYTPSAAKTSTVCPWKGTASYYDVQDGSKVISDAAWYYPTCKEKAKNIEGYVAFYKNKVAVVA